ncbi:hypothetical protein Pth03_74070 [Planotetraspora thailandica]|uniref:Uncharacterized protein n=1 Tax=Planotetraspora thailandica TaxID=487172 RepID=A0A8J3Y195_9ACTN|nr:hypothetical protein Pth03_74070 [Planotetraspora thailandica]
METGIRIAIMGAGSGCVSGEKRLDGLVHDALRFRWGHLESGHEEAWPEHDVVDHAEELPSKAGRATCTRPPDRSETRSQIRRRASWSAPPLLRGTIHPY